MSREQDRAQTRGRAAWSPALLLVLLAMAPAMTIAAKEAPPKEAPPKEALPAEQPTPRCPGMSMDQAIENAERRYKARVVRASVEDSSERCVYVLRLLSEDGRVWSVRVDSRSSGG